MARHEIDVNVNRCQITIYATKQGHLKRKRADWLFVDEKQIAANWERVKFVCGNLEVDMSIFISQILYI